MCMLAIVLPSIVIEGYKTLPVRQVLTINWCASGVNLSLMYIAFQMVYCKTHVYKTNVHIAKQDPITAKPTCQSILMELFRLMGCFTLSEKPSHKIFCDNIFIIFITGVTAKISPCDNLPKVCFSMFTTGENILFPCHTTRETYPGYSCTGAVAVTVTLGFCDKN